VGAADSLLDGLGTLDPTGIVDALHGVTCAVRGDLFNAGISVAGIVFLGDAAKLGRHADAVVEGVVRGADEAAGAALPAALTVGRNADAGVNVFQGIRSGTPVYSGITNDLEGRPLERGDRFDDVRRLTTTPPSRGEARAIEEAMIVRSPGQNLRHETSPSHAWYQQALDWGEQWLTSNGRPR
jgi:hypothetical protein